MAVMYRRGLLGEGDKGKIVYTSSLKDDVEIFKWVIVVLAVHVEELTRQGIISADIARAIKAELARIYQEGLPQDVPYEDVHEYIEARLISRLGPIGGWIGLGRSRNDHVATALRLRLKELMLELMEGIIRLRETLLRKALEAIDKPIIGSTHKQPAQITTYAHYLLAVDELCSDFMKAFKVAFEIVDKSPLGTGPLAGVVTPIDRIREARLLGFGGIVENAIYASGSRFFALLAISILTSFLVELSRFINNIEMWLMPQLGYLEADPTHLATSSAMPHKRNPATLEVLRARIGEVIGDLMALYSILRPTEMGYQLDLQEATRHVWHAFRVALEGIEALRSFIEGSSVNVERTLEDASKYPITTFEYAELMAIRTKRPFREVHQEIACLIRDGRAHDAMLRPDEVLRLKRNIGSPNPDVVKDEVVKRFEEVSKAREEVKALMKALRRRFEEVLNLR